MTTKQKKELIEKRLSEGDSRSYNEIAADLELELWGMRFSSNEMKLRKEASAKSSLKTVRSNSGQNDEA